MTYKNVFLNLAMVSMSFGLAACSNDTTQQQAGADNDAASQSVAKSSERKFDGTVAKPGAPYSLSYRIVGTPIVGSPLVVDLQVKSAVGSQPVNLDFRINDASSMLFAESQPQSIRMEMADNEKSVDQQVTVIPQREGRFYLNVSASYDTESGTHSAVMAVPVQVGDGGRELQENGTLDVDENGEAVRVLSKD